MNAPFPRPPLDLAHGHAGSTPVERPPYPLGEMTSGEIAKYRAGLEREIQRLPGQDRADLQRRLDAVLAELDERERIQANVR